MMPDSRRVVLGVEYDGSAFNGWQVQSPAQQVVTVQGSLEAALSEVAAHPVKLYCAGRTDAGVHACAQVVHFDAYHPRPEKAWVRGGNTLLPDSISIRWAQYTSDEFHARFSATARRYRYIIANSPVRPALLSGQLTPYYQALDEKQMHEAGQYLLGELDFTSYRGAACQSGTPMRNVMHLNVTRRGEFVIIDIKANAFLLHMVRNIAGVLMEIGSGRRPPVWAKEVLELRDRRKAAITAPPHGLYLVEVDYPDHFELPRLPTGPAYFQL